MLAESLTVTMTSKLDFAQITGVIFVSQGFSQLRNQEPSDSNHCELVTYMMEESYSAFDWHNSVFIIPLNALKHPPDINSTVIV